MPETTANTPSLTDLPVEMLAELVQHLPPRSVLNFASIARRFTDAGIYQALLERDFKEDYDDLEKNSANVNWRVEYAKLCRKFYHHPEPIDRPFTAYETEVMTAAKRGDLSFFTVDRVLCLFLRDYHEIPAIVYLTRATLDNQTQAQAFKLLDALLQAPGLSEEIAEQHEYMIPVMQCDFWLSIAYAAFDFQLDELKGQCEAFVKSCVIFHRMDLLGQYVHKINEESSDTARDLLSTLKQDDIIESIVRTRQFDLYSDFFSECFSVESGLEEILAKALAVAYRLKDEKTAQAILDLAKAKFSPKEYIAWLNHSSELVHASLRLGVDWLVSLVAEGVDIGCRHDQQSMLYPALSLCTLDEFIELFSLWQRKGGNVESITQRASTPSAQRTFVQQAFALGRVDIIAYLETHLAVLTSEYSEREDLCRLACLAPNAPEALRYLVNDENFNHAKYNRLKLLASAARLGASAGFVYLSDHGAKIEREQRENLFKPMPSLLCLAAAAGSPAIVEHIAANRDRFKSQLDFSPNYYRRQPMPENLKYFIDYQLVMCLGLKLDQVYSGRDSDPLLGFFEVLAMNLEIACERSISLCLKEFAGQLNVFAQSWQVNRKVRELLGNGVNYIHYFLNGLIRCGRFDGQKLSSEAVAALKKILVNDFPLKNEPQSVNIPGTLFQPPPAAPNTQSRLHGSSPSPP